MLPAIKPYVSGQRRPQLARQPPPVSSSTPPPPSTAGNVLLRPDERIANDRVAIASRVHPGYAATEGYEHLFDVFHRCVSHVVRPESNVVDVQAGLRGLARHLERFSHDTLAEDVAAHCVERLASSGGREGPITRAWTASVVVCADQLFALLCQRCDAVLPVVQDVRDRLQRLIFLEGPCETPAGMGAKANMFAANGLPKIVKSRSTRVEAELEGPYVDRGTFAEASARLVDRVHATQREVDVALDRVRRVQNTGRRVATLQQRRICVKAFDGWRFAVKVGKLERAHASALKDADHHVAQCEGAMARRAAQQAGEQRSAEAVNALLRNELHVVRKQHGAFQEIADHSRLVSDDLRRQVNDLQRGALARLQTHIGNLDAELEVWRCGVAGFAAEAALTPWEELCRVWHHDAIFGAVSSVAARFEKTNNRPHLRTGEGYKDCGGTLVADLSPNSTSVLPVKAPDPSRVVPFCEDLASPFVGFIRDTGGAKQTASVQLSAATVKHAGATAVARPPRACFHAVSPYVVRDLLCLVYSITPGHIPLADLRSLLAMEPFTAAKRFTTILSDLGVPLYGLSASDILTLTKVRLEAVVLSIFARLCGISVSGALLPPTLNDIGIWMETFPSTFGQSAFAKRGLIDTAAAAGARRPGLQPVNPKMEVASAAVPRFATLEEFLDDRAIAAQKVAAWRTFGMACFSSVLVRCATAFSSAMEPQMAPLQAAQVAQLRSLRAARLCSDPELGLPTEAIERLRLEVFTEALCRDLRELYVVYAAGVFGDPVTKELKLKREDFVRLVLDSRLVVDNDARAGRRNLIDVEFALRQATAASTDTSELCRLGTSDFSEWIVRFAFASKYHQKNVAEQRRFRAAKAAALNTSATPTAPKVTVSEDELVAAVEHTAQQLLLHCSGGLDSNVIAPAMRKPGVTALFDEEQLLVKRVFRTYSCIESGKSDQELTFGEAAKFCVDAGLVGAEDNGVPPDEDLVSPLTARSTGGGKDGAARASRPRSSPAKRGGNTNGGNGSTTPSAKGGKKANGAGTKQPTGDKDGEAASLEDLLPKPCSYNDVRALFYRVVDAHDLGAAGLMRLPAFREFLCGLAFLVTPSPLVVTHHKLRALCADYLHPLMLGAAPRSKGKMAVAMSMATVGRRSEG